MTTDLNLDDFLSAFYSPVCTATHPRFRDVKKYGVRDHAGPRGHFGWDRLDIAETGVVSIFTESNKTVIRLPTRKNIGQGKDDLAYSWRAPDI